MRTVEEILLALDYRTQYKIDKRTEEDVRIEIDAEQILVWVLIVASAISFVLYMRYFIDYIMSLG